MCSYSQVCVGYKQYANSMAVSGTWLKEDYELDVDELGWSLSLAIGMGEFTASFATVFAVEKFGAAR